MASGLLFLLLGQVQIDYAKETFKIMKQVKMSRKEMTSISVLSSTVSTLGELCAAELCIDRTV